MGRASSRAVPDQSGGESVPASHPPAPVVVTITNQLLIQVQRLETTLALMERTGRYEHHTYSELRGVAKALRELAA